MNILLVSIPLAIVLSFATIGTSSNCVKPGMACRSCSEPIVCVQNGTNFTEQPAGICLPNTTCLNGGCIYGSNPACPNNNTNNNNTEVQYDFECQTPGMYPDPFDCSKYHYCVPIRNNSIWGNEPLKRVTEKCGCDYSYNMRTTFCDTPKKNESCSSDYPLARCNSTGQTGILRQNPSLYYICQNRTNNYYPFIYACQNGKRYDANSYLCK